LRVASNWKKKERSRSPQNYLQKHAISLNISFCKLEKVLQDTKQNESFPWPMWYKLKSCSICSPIITKFDAEETSGHIIGDVKKKSEFFKGIIRLQRLFSTVPLQTSAAKENW